MQFNSYIFILVFAPLMVVGYFTLGRINNIIRKLVLVISSIIFYVFAGWLSLIIMSASIAINYLLAKCIQKCKWRKVYLLIPLIVNTCLLIFFKYRMFAVTNINQWFGTSFALKELALPLGISFFTFQQIAYVVAAYRKELSEINFLDYVSYILYFPKLVMGPLMDPVDFISQYNDPVRKKVNWNNIASGLKIFSFGLLKKVLLADTFAQAVSWGFANSEVASSVEWLLVMLSYTFEIYFDFSGYSDMAVGISQMLNITLPINFDSPYKAISIRDFWKRWHISLTKFLTKYIYLPLGGSRKGQFFTCLNTMIVFLISGIWHGANWTFILWGILHGLFSVLDRLLEKPVGKIVKPVRWLFTFIVVNILWLLFRAESVKQWGEILHTIVTWKSSVLSNGFLTSFKFPEAAVLYTIIPASKEWRSIIMLLFTVAASVICFVPNNNYRKADKLTWYGMLFAAFAFVWGLTCLGTESVFVYNNF